MLKIKNLIEYTAHAENKKEERKVNREKLEARKIRNKTFKFKIKNKLVISLFFDYLNLAFE